MKELKQMKKGDYVILEDNMTIFGEMGINKGAVGKVKKVYNEYENDKRCKKVDVKWLSGNKKGETSKRIFGDRFKKIEKKEAKR